MKIKKTFIFGNAKIYHPITIEEISLKKIRFEDKVNNKDLRDFSINKVIDKKPIQ